MTIKQFMQTEILLPGLRQADILVILDLERCYRDLYRESPIEQRVAVDAGGGTLVYVNQM